MPRKKKKDKDRARVVSFTVPPVILRKSQKKADIMNMSYSAYIVKLIEKDLEDNA